MNENLIPEEKEVPTADVIKKYEGLGWMFVSHSWRAERDSKIEIFYRFKSKRMSSNGMIHEKFTEKQLLKEESEFYVRQLFGSMIAITFNQTTINLIRELASLQRLKDAGKPVEFPSEIVIKDLKIPIGYDLNRTFPKDSS